MARRTKQEILVDAIMSFDLDELTKLRTLIETLIEEKEVELEPEEDEEALLLARLRELKKKKSTKKKPKPKIVEREEDDNEDEPVRQKPRRRANSSSKKRAARTEPLKIKKGVNNFDSLMGNLRAEERRELVKSSKDDKKLWKGVSPTPRLREANIDTVECSICGEPVKVTESTYLRGMSVKCNDCCTKPSG